MFSPYIAEVRDRLNRVSPSFCMAKWLQVTIHLPIGHTHSCHHPKTHRIPPEELLISPSALHNTSHKKERRKEMLEGVRPVECDYCWNVEGSTQDQPSDRHLKSADWWSVPRIDEIAAMPWDADVFPSYVEVSFSTTCNFKCSYCGPHASSKWMEEMRKHGKYPLDWYNNIEWMERNGQIPTPEAAPNPYVDAFWKWWPDLYRELSVFRITGGEPLLSKHTFRVLEYILEHPNPHLELGINSNLGVPDEQYDRFLATIAEIRRRGCLKNFILYTSGEAHGRRAEYVRFGLDYTKWLRNVDRFLHGVDDWKVVVMSTFNALSVTSYRDFMNDMLTLRRGRFTADGASRLIVDIPYLRHPEHQSVLVLPDDYAPLMDQVVGYVHSSAETHEIEKTKIDRVRTILRNNPWDAEKRDDVRRCFYWIFSEYDRRRGTSFSETFPEMVPFYDLCKDLALG